MSLACGSDLLNCQAVFTSYGSDFITYSFESTANKDVTLENIGRLIDCQFA